MNQGNSPTVKGYGYAILAAALYAMISVFGKLILHNGVHPFVVIFYQNLVAAIVICGGAAIFNRSLFRVTPDVLKSLIIQGLIGAFGTNICFYLALQHLNAGITSMLLFTNPIFVSAFFAATGIKKLKVTNYIALFLAMVGAVLVLNIFGVGLKEMSVEGIVLGLLSSLTYAFYNVYADLKLSSINPYMILLYTTLSGLIASGITVMGVLGTIPPVDSQSLMYIVLVSVIAGILPVVFFYRSIALIGSEKTSIVSTLELPFTLLLAFWILSEKLNLLQGGGVVLMLAATVLLQRQDMQTEPDEDFSKEVEEGSS